MATNAAMTNLFAHQSVCDSMQVLGMNGVTTLAGLAIKTGASAIAKFANTVVYKINGKMYQKTTADLALPVITIPTGSQALVAWFLDASGNITSAASSVVLSSDTLPGLPTFADTLCCIGAAKIVNASGANFVGATTALDKSGITVTYYNLANAFSGMIV